MKKLSLAPICLLILLVSCEKKDPAPAVTSHMITIDARTLTMNSNLSYFVSASDKLGNVLATRQVVSKDTVHLNTKTSDSEVTLTYYLLGGPGWSGFSNIVSYGGVDANSTLIFNPYNQQASDNIAGGSFNLSFENWPTEQYPISYSSPIDQGGAFTSPTYPYSIFVPSTDTVSVLLSSYSTENVPLYQWFHHVGNNDKVIADFNNLTPYKKVIPVTFDGNVNSSITGYQTNQTTGVLFNYTFNATTAARSLGYLDGFQNYLVWAQGIIDKSTTSSYEKLGSLPAAVALPHFTSSVTNTSIYQFTFTIDHPYTYSTAYFTSSTTATYWTINSPTGQSVVIGDVPAEVAKKFPIHAATFTFTNANAVQRMDGTAYSAFVDLSFGSVGKGANHEFASYGFAQ